MADSNTPDQGFCFFSEKEKKEMRKDHDEFMVNEKKKTEEMENNRKTMMPDIDGIVVECKNHGRYYIEYDLPKYKIVNRILTCPICGNENVDVIGEYVLDIPQRSGKLEY